MQPFYIGVGKDEKFGRYPRAYSDQSRNKHWHSIIKKTEYRIDILMEDLDYREAEEKEKEFILLYGRVNNGNGILCNLTDGGGGTLGLPLSESQKKNLSKFFTGRKLSEAHLQKMRDYVFTEEHKNNLRNSLKGRVVSKETRDKISKANKGHKITQEQIEKMKISKRKSFELNGRKPHSEETKKKIAISNSKRIVSEEAKRKISEFNKGKVLSEETKLKISKAKKGEKKNPNSVQKTLKTKRERIKTYGFWNGYIYAYKSEDMSFVGKFETFRDVTKSIGVHSASIYKVLRGQLKSTCGYFFKKDL